uniref:RING-type domain-containing protein n=1 Tax=Leersia perrieri TaxID=77586 RepID=A0A0D9VUL5_9ORYZ
MSNNTGAKSPGAMGGYDDDGDRLARYMSRLEMRVMLAFNDMPEADLYDLLASALRGAATGSGAPAASDEAIQALEDVAITDGSQMECAICLDHGTEAAARWKEMPCGHRFHGACLENWLHLHGTCPMCRHQMPTAEAPPAAPEVEQEEDAGETSEQLLLMVRVHVSGGDDNDGDGTVEVETSHPVLGALVMLAPPAAVLAGYIFRCSGRGLTDSSSSSSSSPEDGCGVDPASREAVEALDDVIVLGDDDGTECAICLDQHPAASRWKKMPCGHRFHGGCACAAPAPCAAAGICHRHRCASVRPLCTHDIFVQNT